MSFGGEFIHYIVPSEKDEFQKFLLEKVPLNLRDEGAAVLDQKDCIMDLLREAFNIGQRSQDNVIEKLHQEITTQTSRIEGLQLALQDKVQIHHNVINKKRWWQR